MKKIVLATKNPGKIREFSTLLAPLDFTICSMEEFNLASPIEDGGTFVENALIKARQACIGSGLGAIADDSGLAVDALAGLPGIHSARYAATAENPNPTDQDNNRKLIDKMQSIGTNYRSARFHCVIVYMRFANDPMPLVCAGSWQGEIILSPRGSGGFGYDPLFYLKEFDCTSAELAADQKNQFSHRAKAMNALMAQLREQAVQNA